MDSAKIFHLIMPLGLVLYTQTVIRGLRSGSLKGESLIVAILILGCFTLGAFLRW